MSSDPLDDALTHFIAQFLIDPGPGQLPQLAEQYEGSFTHAQEQVPQHVEKASTSNYTDTDEIVATIMALQPEVVTPHKMATQTAQVMSEAGAVEIDNEPAKKPGNDVEESPTESGQQFGAVVSGLRQLLPDEVPNVETGQVVGSNEAVSYLRRTIASNAEQESILTTF
jgi:hypothetical protein